MKLSNRFKKADLMRVWLDTPYCIECGSNQQCSAHHILGCKHELDSSILNSAMLCHFHHKIADGNNVSNAEFQSSLLKRTMTIVLRSGYELKKKDTDFYTQHKNLYDLP
jgi:predicted restriction endonuclease